MFAYVMMQSFPLQSRGIKLVDAVTHGDIKAIDDILSKDVDLDVQIVSSEI